MATIMAEDTPCVVLFYKYFVPRPKLLEQEQAVEALRRHQIELCHRLDLKGRVLLAQEGINGTLYARNSKILQEYIATMESFDLAKDCELTVSKDTVGDDNDEANSCRLYSGIDWKQSTSSSSDPFPDLKISLVKEIISTGGAVSVDELESLGGKHLSPTEFHRALLHDKNAVVIDVRNTFEHDIGHFVNPNTNEPAMNPETVVFSNFDSTFVAKQASALKDKPVLLYCTGGIRCEKASVMLRKRGVSNVSQLRGGIHRYLEEFGESGLFRGKNFVFDQRVSALDPSSSSLSTAAVDIVGKCIECEVPFDEISGSRLCTVCRDLVLVCPKCQTSLYEYHCTRHSTWKTCYFTFLEVFDTEQLLKQKEQLVEIREALVPPSEHKNVRRTLLKQIEKVDKRIEQLESGDVKVNRNAPRRCRSCMKTNDQCDGMCWGFWKRPETSEAPKKRKSSCDKTGY